MKKIIFSLILGLISCGLSQAQDLSRYISKLADSENIQRQVIDHSMIEASVEAAKAMDPTGKLAEQIPPFMMKLDTIDIMDLTPCLPEIKSDFMVKFDSLTEGAGYKILLAEDEDNDRVKILSRTEEDLTKELIILAVDTEKNEIVVLKLTGNLAQSDVEKILEEPSQITGK